MIINSNNSSVSGNNRVSGISAISGNNRNTVYNSNIMSNDASQAEYNREMRESPLLPVLHQIEGRLRRLVITPTINNLHDAFESIDKFINILRGVEYTEVNNDLRNIVINLMQITIGVLLPN